MGDRLSCTPVTPFCLCCSPPTQEVSPLFVSFSVFEEQSAVGGEARSVRRSSSNLVVNHVSVEPERWNVLLRSGVDAFFFLAEEPDAAVVDLIQRAAECSEVHSLSGVVLDGELLAVQADVNSDHGQCISKVLQCDRADHLECLSCFVAELLLGLKVLRSGKTEDLLLDTGGLGGFSGLAEDLGQVHSAVNGNNNLLSDLQSLDVPKGNDAVFIVDLDEDIGVILRIQLRLLNKNTECSRAPVRVVDLGDGGVEALGR